MTNEKLDTHWPGPNVRLVVEEMIGDKNSMHWDECSKFVKRLVYSKVKNIPANIQEEIAQDIMYKVTKYLPSFEFRSGLKTWINLLTQSYIIDVYRKRQNQVCLVPLNDPFDEIDGEGEIFVANATRSAESLSMINDELRTAVALLIEYTNSHSHPVRDQLILQMVIFEKRTYMETAQAVGCQPPVVGHVVREARRYVREKMEQM